MYWKRGYRGQGAILFIEPGVTLKYNPGTSILVRGGIDARGTEERVITFNFQPFLALPGAIRRPEVWSTLGPGQLFALLYR